MYILYNIALMLATLAVFPYLLVKFVSAPKYRGGVSQKLGRVRKGVLKVIKDSPRPIWVHAVSVGEVMAAHPLVRDLKKTFPNKKLILSTVTVTGNLTAKQRVPEADAVFYFPFDYPWIVRRVIGKINPAIVLVAETELWPNFFRELKKAGIPSAVVNGRISPTSFRNYLKLKTFFARVFDHVDLFLMQSETDALRIKEIGAPDGKVIITGNLKFDQKIPTSQSSPLRIPSERRVIVAGSTHRGEESILLEIFSRLKEKYPSLTLIIAPRHPERFNEVEGLILKAGHSYQRRSRMSSEIPGEIQDILLLDTIGELRSFYGICEIAFVGGSLVKVGGHNLLEPAVMKKPIIFSRYMFNFKEISEALISAGGGIMVRDKEDLYDKIDTLLSDREYAQRLGLNAFKVIEANTGATKRTISHISHLLH